MSSKTKASGREPSRSRVFQWRLFMWYPGRMASY